MSSMFDFDDSINLAYNAKMAGKNLVTAKHEVLGKTGDFLFLAHSDREFALRCQMAEADIESAALRKMANVSDSKAKLVRALHEEWKLRHANCGTCKVATPYEFREVRPSIVVDPKSGVMTAIENAPKVESIKCDGCNNPITGEGLGNGALPTHFVVTQGEDGKETITQGPDSSHGVTDQVGGTLRKITLCTPCAEKRAIKNLGRGRQTTSTTTSDEEKDFLASRRSSKIAGDLEPQILQELEEIEQMMQCMCGASCRGQFNGTPQCAPGEGCAVNAIPGACGQCGQSFQGHDVCSCRGGCAVQWNPSHESVADKVADHDEWAAKTNHGRGEAGPQLFSLGSSTALPKKESSFVVESMSTNYRSKSRPKGLLGYGPIIDGVIRGIHPDIDGQTLRELLRGDRLLANGRTAAESAEGGSLALLVSHPKRSDTNWTGLEHLRKLDEDPERTDMEVLPVTLQGKPGEPALTTPTVCHSRNSMYGHSGHVCKANLDGSPSTHMMVIGEEPIREEGSRAHCIVADPKSRKVAMFDVPHGELLVPGPDTHEAIRNVFNSLLGHYRDSQVIDGFRPYDQLNLLHHIGRIYHVRGTEGQGPSRGLPTSKVFLVTGVAPYENDPDLTTGVHFGREEASTQAKTNIDKDYWNRARTRRGPILSTLELRVLPTSSNGQAAGGADAAIWDGQRIRSLRELVGDPNGSALALKPAWRSLEEIGTEIPRQSGTNEELIQLLKGSLGSSSNSTQGPSVTNVDINELLDSFGIDKPFGKPE